MIKICQAKAKIEVSCYEEPKEENEKIYFSSEPHNFLFFYS